MLKCGFLMYTCFCCGACGCTEGTPPCREGRGSWRSPQRCDTAGGVVGAQRCFRAAHLSHCLPAPSRARPGTMRLWVCIALLSMVLCASAERPAFVRGIVRAGQFVRDAAGGKLLSPGSLPSGTPPQAQVTSSQWCSPRSWESHSSTSETPLVSAAG